MYVSRSGEAVPHGKPLAIKAQWRDPGFKTVTKTFTTKNKHLLAGGRLTCETVKKYADAQEAKVAEGTYRDPRIQKTTLNQFVGYEPETQDFDMSAGYWTQSPTREEATLRVYRIWYRSQIAPYLGTKRMGAINRKDVAIWIDTLKKRLVRDGGPANSVKSATVKSAQALLSSIFSVALDDETLGLVGNPALRPRNLPVQTKGQGQVIPPRTVWEIAQAVSGRYKALVFTMYGGALRVGECMGLRVCDVDFENQRLRIENVLKEQTGHMGFGPPKNKDVAEIIVPRFATDALQDHLEGYTQREALVWAENTDDPMKALIFTDGSGHHLRQANFRARVWYPTLKELGLSEPLPHIHDLRQSGANLAKETGAALKDVQTLGRWASPTVLLDHYAVSTTEAQKQTADRMDAAFRKLMG